MKSTTYKQQKFNSIWEKYVITLETIKGPLYDY